MEETPFTETNNSKEESKGRGRRNVLSGTRRWSNVRMEAGSIVNGAGKWSDVLIIITSSVGQTDVVNGAESDRCPQQE